MIFKAKTIQNQWFPRRDIEKAPSLVTNSANGSTSNEIALEWLEKVFLPQTAPSDLSRRELLILDGHGSHTTAEFTTTCYQHNVYLLFLPAHTSHVVQPLDLGCFSSLKTAYRRQLADWVALTDSTRVGKAQFLDFYQKPEKARSRRRILKLVGVQQGCTLGTGLRHYLHDG